MKNKNMDKIIQTYNCILTKDSKYKMTLCFFARRTIQNYNKHKYSKKEQKVLDGLLDYYKKPSKKRAHY